MIQNSTSNVQQTSLEAFEEVRQNLGERQRQVFEILKEIQPATNTMIAHYLRLPINCITPRIFELRQKNLVEMSHIDKCPITGRKAIFWKVV